MGRTFGDFDSIESFLNSYAAARRAEIRGAEQDLSLAARRTRRRKEKDRDVVEVDATIETREKGDTNPRDGFHYHLIVKLTKIYTTDPDVDEDLKDHLESGRKVFVAVRWGDRLGIPDAIDGLDEGVSVGLKGEYITAAKARAHGGEQMAVLHFTHRPVGFVVVGEWLYE